MRRSQQEIELANSETPSQDTKLNRRILDEAEAEHESKFQSPNSTRESESKGGRIGEQAGCTRAPD